MNISSDHKVRLIQINQEIDVSTVVQLGKLLGEATSISKLYGEDWNQNRLLFDLRLTHSKQYYRAINYKWSHKNLPQLISELRNNFKRDLLPYIG